MTRIKDERYYAAKLLAEVNKLLSFAKRVDFSDPERNEEALYAVGFCVVQARETIGHLSSEFCRSKLGIRPDRFFDFRNLLVHEYGKTDYSAYEQFVRVDVVHLKIALEEYLG
jgi:uncharacterized protein with HEPN domain